MSTALCASRKPSLPQLHPAGSEPHTLLLKALSGEHPVEGAAPAEPQPKKSFETASLPPQLVAQLELLQGGLAKFVPVAHTPQPVLDCRVVKNCPAVGDALVQPVDERDITSPADAHTCQPTAQRSATLQPTPVGRDPLLPPALPQAGLSERDSTPGT